MMGKYVHLCVPCGIVRWTPYKPMPLSEEWKCVLISVDAAMGLPKYFYIRMQWEKSPVRVSPNIVFYI